ncbi:MAG: lysophospholipid acyltransferase family protein [Candidatus Omnitrophota bacterium]|jgi:KDO2-lipid IV(A) lauroyltransferase
MLYSLYILGFSLANLLPLGVGYAVAVFIARGYWFFARRDQAELKENLRVVLGDDVSEKVLDKHVRAIFKNFAKYLVDFFKFTQFTEEYVAEHFKIEGRENLDRALDEGKGAVLTSLHLGNWELGGAVVGGLKYPISAIVLEHKNKRINDFFTRQRSINEMKSIPIGLSIKECFKALKRNEFLAIAGDKDYTSNGIYVDFFNRKALIPKGPAAFSLKTGAPIIITMLVREKDDSFKLIMEEPIRYKSTGDYEKDIIILMELYLKRCEKYIRKYPDQWYVFRRIWEPQTITR